MGEVKDVLVPDIGDFDEVDVIEVLVASGDDVAKEDSLITLESDKATMDVPAPFAGTVREVKVKAGDRIGQGALILSLDTAGTPEPVGEGLDPSRSQSGPVPGGRAQGPPERGPGSPCRLLPGGGKEEWP